MFSSIVFLTAFFGFEKLNSSGLHKGFIDNVNFQRDSLAKNDITTNINLNSYSTNLAYSGTDELGAYWYGIGIGIGETLCYSMANGYISNNIPINMMRDYRNIYRGGDDFRSVNFEEGIQLAIDGYPGCRL